MRSRPPFSATAGVIFASVLLGVLSVYRPGLAVGATMVLLAVALSRLRLHVAFLVASSFALAIPTGWGMSRALPFLNVQLGPGAVALQVLLPLGVVALWAISRVSRQAGTPQTVGAPVVWSRLLVLWLVVVVIGLAIGVDRYGIRDALSDGQMYALYAVLAVPLLDPKVWGALGPDRVVLVALLSLLAYSGWVLMVLLVGGLHDLVYSGTAMERTRVGFATTSLMVLFIPLGVTALSSPGLRLGERTFVWASIGVLGLAVLVSQSRAVVIGLAAALGIVLVMPWSSTLKRGHRLASTVMVVLLAVLGIGAVFSSTDLLSTATDFVSRGQLSYTDPSYQARTLTYSALWNRLSGSGSLATGLGIGSTAYAIAPSGAIASEFYFIDNAVLTVILKSGIVGAAVFVAVLTAMWVFAVRVARSGGPYARTIAVSLPFFLAVSGISSAQLVNAPSVPVGLAVVAAVLVAESGALRDREVGSEAQSG